MSLAAKNDLIFSPPPTFDWTDLVIGDDLKALEKRVDLYETSSRGWRATIGLQMQTGLKEVEGSLTGVPKELAAEVIAKSFGGVLKALEENIENFSVPMHSNPEMKAKLEELAKLSTSAGKFVRKLMRRVEKIRVSQHSVSVDLYYGLLAFLSEHTDEANQGETFSDPSNLGSYLRRQIA
jgi:hypothetical protein